MNNLYFDFLARVQIPKDKFHPLYTNGSFILGQEQDSTGPYGNFDKLQSWSGKITQMEMWNTLLTPQEIWDIANCVKATIPFNRVVTWVSKAWKLVKMDPLIDVPLESLCQKNLLLNKFFWTENIGHDTLSYFCEVVDGI